MKPLFRSVLVASALALSGCAASNAPDAFAADPYEGANRAVHGFNKGVDTVALRPAAVVYDVAAPALVKHLVGNALDTLALPGRFFNRVLQGDVEAALTAAGRLTVNLIMGLGVLDPATEMGLPSEPTDFGVTLARMGVEEGPYLELPLLGPSTARDAVGLVGDVLLNPLTYAASGTLAGDYGYLRAPVAAVHGRAGAMAAIDQALYESEDSYIAVRSAYLQRRRRQIEGGASAESLPDIYGQ
ncbi:MlaA family lipoprotein [Oceanicella actignis]|uniref:Phospholipid-binding lipoprotein MlaA n=1 Tax=Oceanicella actignis TaxID=1189325 RepID=A0A1M7RRY0_9RHOB|nr:VacJ family lipoprotein [Oceanicella actignis]SET06935.1 phospholipid-binding lipoprotein MlaA [Oceanicella actignis]SHN48882.1 phospholipid-binding lipoprotein MlaA [Oceanicella actignis]